MTHFDPTLAALMRRVTPLEEEIKRQRRDIDELKKDRDDQKRRDTFPRSF